MTEEEYEGEVARLLMDATALSAAVYALPRRGRDIEWLAIHSHAADAMRRLSAELGFLRRHKEVTNG